MSGLKQQVALMLSGLNPAERKIMAQRFGIELPLTGEIGPSALDSLRPSLGLRDMAQACWQNAEDHGFHEEGANNEMPSWCANLHGEVSELWEAYRLGQLELPCGKPNLDLTCAQEELADIIIRVMDIAVQMQIDIERAVAVKHRYNVSRPRRHGGKRA